MSEPVGESPSSGVDGRDAWTWLLPALTFLVGAGLSAALFALGDTDDAELTAPAGPRSAEPTEGDLPSDEQEVVVRVPAACIEAAELAQTVISALSDVADAAAAFDARRLQESLDVVQQMRPEVEATASECRDLTADARIVTQDPTGTPTPTDSASVTPAG